MYNFNIIQCKKLDKQLLVCDEYITQYSLKFLEILLKIFGNFAWNFRPELTEIKDKIGLLNFHRFVMDYSKLYVNPLGTLKKSQKNRSKSGNLGKIVRFAIRTKPDFVLIKFVLSEDSLYYFPKPKLNDLEVIIKYAYIL